MQHNIYRTIFLSILYICQSFITIQADSNFFFSHLGVENGLSQVSVLHIFQDSDGYLWFGTRNGINKYDGYKFTVFLNEVNNPESLSDGYIRAINEDKEKNIWVGTNNGLNCIDPVSGKITRFYPRSIHPESKTNVTGLLFKHSDGILYALSGSYLFRCNTDKSLEPIKKLTESAFAHQSITQDKNGDIYIGYEYEGIYVFSSEWEFKKHILPEQLNKDGSSSIFINVLFADEDDIWIGIEDRGLSRYDTRTGSFTYYNTSNTELSNNSIRCLLYMNTDSMLIGSFGGLNIWNKKDDTITPVRMNIEGEGGLNHYSIHSMLLDKDQTLWIGTYSAGINYHSPYYKPFYFISPTQYAGIMGKGVEDKSGNLWFATEGAGLFYYNPQNGDQKLFPLKPLEDNNYERNIIKSTLIDGDFIYCSTHFGSVYKFSIPDQKYSLVYDSGENDIYSLYMDRKKRLWIPCFNKHNLTLIDKGNITNRFKTREGEISFANVTIIHELRPDVFLIGCYRDSIFLYDMEERTVSNISKHITSLKEHERLGTITSILQDSLHVWISTNKGGLFRFDNELNFQKQYQKEDGLAGSYISSMVITGNNDLWIATNNELYLLNKKDDKFYPINPVDLPTQEYTLHAASTSSNGTIFFPASKGVLAFNPLNIKTNTTIPPVYITSLITNNHEDMIDRIVMRTDSSYSIQLKASQNNLSISYAALNYIHPDGNQYIYRMDGADNTWHNVGNRREAYYSNLAPGNYIFRLKASNNDGVWNPKETSLHITVMPPLYKTWWAYLFYLLLAAFIVIKITQYQHRKHELERDIRFKQKEQDRMKELHDERMRMFNNFSHELRTPLTLIMNPLEELAQKASFSEDVKRALRLMKKNTQRMLLLVNNLMDIQKYEAGKSLLQKSPFNFSAFIEEIYTSFENAARKRDITFELKNELPVVYSVNYDEAEIEKLFFNLLSNAIKFTPKNGTISLHISKMNESADIIIPDYILQENPALYLTGYLCIEVKDTGKGFTREEGEKIFEPFYRFQDDIHQQISGTGIGLSLARSIASQHGGYIWAESTFAKGTSFYVLLPDTESQDTEKEMQVPASENSIIHQKVSLLLEEAETQHKPLILIVDDDAEIREYLKQQLHPDYHIITAGNGKEAFSMMEKKPDLVISDVLMPEMNGIELCKQIRSHPEYADTLVILLTAKSMTSQVEEGLNTGADDYIIKPFQIAILKARIRNLLRSNRNKPATNDLSPLLQTVGIDVAPEKKDFLAQYITIVKDNISNPELDVSLIYEQLGMSRANFYRKVKTITGLSPIELIRNIRLEVGAQLLKETDLNISEIAQKTGFSSRSYFARNFKLVYGVSPTEYQEANKTDQK